MGRHLRLLLRQTITLTATLTLVIALLVWATPPPRAEASVSTGGAFGSAVPCLTSTDQFAITRYDNTVFGATTPASYPALQTVVGGAGNTQAFLNSIGAVYGLAYDDGAASGRERLFVGAYTKRLVAYGSQGPGGIYMFERSGASWALTGAFSVSGAVGVTHSGAGNAPVDQGALAGVGTTALGGMVISPDGTALYVVNVGAKQIVRFSLPSSGLPTIVATFPVNLSSISFDPTVQNDLTPFALAWYNYPLSNGQPLLLVGVTDTARRGVTVSGGVEETPRMAGANFVVSPRAYVLMFNPVVQSWYGQFAALDLGNDPAFANRHAGSNFANWSWTNTQTPYVVRGWNPWRNQLKNIAGNGYDMHYPQPLLTTIEFVRDTAPTAGQPEPRSLLLLGLRDRTGDMAFNGGLAVPAGERIAIAQGDTVVLRWNGGGYTTVAGDYYDDNTLSVPGSTPNAHIENHQGALARLPGLGTSVGSAGDTLVATTLGGQSSHGLRTWANNAGVGGAGAYANLISTADHAATKASNLGDVEVLCSYALVGGRVWNDGQADGIQNGADAGLAGVTLEVFTGDPLTAPALATATTDAQGRYLFALPPNRNLSLRLSAASRTALGSQGYRFTQVNAAGSSETTDSDVAPFWGYMEFNRSGPPGTTGVAITAPWRTSDGRSYDLGLTKVSATGQIGDRVWRDSNGNGVQEAGEPGVAGVTVRLEGVATAATLGGPINRSTTTDANGTYAFTALPAGRYRVNFSLPPGQQATRKDQGGNDALDSDADAASGYATSFFDLADGQIQPQWDFGLTGGDVAITKTGPATAAADLSFTYTLVARNLTGNAANTVIVADTLPAKLTFVSANPAPTSRVGQTLTWNLGVLAGNASRSINVTVQPLSTSITPPATTTLVQNCASITSAEPDSNLANNSACANTTLQRITDVTISKTGPLTAVANQSFSYALTVRNQTASLALAVVVSDPLPAGLVYVSASPAPTSVAGQTLSWSLGTLAGNANRTITVNVRAPVTFTPPTAVTQRLTNCASVTTATTDSNLTNNSACATTDFQRPEVSLVKSAPATALVGDELTYTLVYANRGSLAASNVTLSDNLPAGLRVVRFTANPLGCTSTATTVNCVSANLAAGASGTISFVARTDVATVGTSIVNVATLSTTTVGDDPQDNSSSATTLIQFPNPGVTLGITPNPLPVGEPGSLTATYRNPGTGVARTAVLTITYDPGATLGALPAGCTANAAARRVICTLGDLAAGATGSVGLPLRLPATPIDGSTFVANAFAATAQISSATPERAADQADNTANVTTDVVRPNVYVTATGPDAAARLTWGSGFVYTVGYGNLYRAVPRLTRAAATSVLTVTLPTDVALLTASVPPTRISGQTLVWDLGTLNPAAAGSLRLAVRTNVPAGTLLTMATRISTVTPGDDPSDNAATVATTIVAPPVVVPTPTTGSLRLAIHSDLDPNHGGASETDGVYLTPLGATGFTWPTGEVLDFAPRLASYSLAAPSWPLEYRARVTGWSVTSFTVNGRTVAPTAADSRSVAGCRGAGHAPSAGSLLTGCVSSYMGAYPNGRALDAFLPTVTALRELDMATQGHVYWTQPPAPPMRPDVYLFTLDPLAAPQITVAVEVEVWALNVCPDFLLNPLGACGTPIELPQPPRTRQPLAQTYTVTLVVPRSVVGPGGVVPGGR